MAHPKYGDKHTCFQCGARFYTMGKPVAICPKCSADQRKTPKKSAVRHHKPVAVAENEYEEHEEEEETNEIPPLEEQSEFGHHDGDSIKVDEEPTQDF